MADEKLNEEITNYAADGDVTGAAPAPASEPLTSAGKKRGRSKFNADPVPAPEPEESYIDARTRLELEAGAATLKANQERLKQAK